MKNFFGIVAPLYEHVHFGAEKTFRKLESIVDFKPSDKILDLGGGTGRVAKFLTQKVESVLVVDSSKKMLKQCQKQRPTLHCKRAEAQSLPLANNSIDIIIMVDAFHHFKNQKKVVAEIKRVLVKNGKVVMEEFNPLSVFGALVKIIEKLLFMQSVFYRPSALSDLFMNAGFQVQIVDQEKSVYYLSAIKVPEVKATSFAGGFYPGAEGQD